MSHKRRRALIAVVAIAAPTLFVALQFPRELMFSATTATGGDLGSHNYAAAQLRGFLWNRGQLTGWVPGNYCGFPLFQIYFPLPFVIGAVASILLEPNVAFKLTSILGLVLLPASSFLLLRRLRAPYPGPELGASCTLLFLFQGGNAMWGGNLGSTLAGEFVYSLSLPLALAYLAQHDGAISGIRRAAWAASLVALLAMTHAYTVLWVATTVAFAALMRPNPAGNLLRHALVFAWGGALCAFWLGPLVWYSPWTTAYKHVWVINSMTEIFPPLLWPALGCAAICSAIVRLRGREAWNGLWETAHVIVAGILAAGLSYAVAPNFGIVDVRFLPMLQLMLCVLAAAAAGHALNGVVGSIMWIPITFLATMILAMPEADRLRGWIRWNYEGFERKSLWPAYAQLSNVLRGDFTLPRVAYEHAPENEALGTVRAFENLPLFSGRSTLEGVNLQASVTAPFVFYIQSEISQVMSCPFPEWGCSRPNLPSGVEHLEMMNVSDVILRSDASKAAAAKLTRMEHRSAAGPYDVYRVLQKQPGYVVPLEVRPYAVVTDDWKAVAYQWFKRATMNDAMPVFVSDRGLTAAGTFSGVFSNIPSDVARVHEPPPARPLTVSMDSERIAVSGAHRGQPLLIRISYHPRWRALTGERVWLAGPGFMLVFPYGDRLELVYSSSFVTQASAALTGLSLVAGLLVIAGLAPGPARARRGATPTPESTARELRRPDHRFVDFARHKKFLFWAPLCVLSGTLITIGIRARGRDADRVYQSAQRELDKGRLPAARASFARARQLAPLSNTAIHSFYFEAIVLYRQEQWHDAARVFQQLLDNFPEAPSAAEAQYHIGLCAQRQGNQAEAVRRMIATQRDFPGTIWAGFAAERVRDLGGLK